MVASIRCKAILLALLPLGLSMAQIGPTGGGGSGTAGPAGPVGPAGPAGPAGLAPAGTGTVVVNSGVASVVTISGDAALNPTTGALTLTKTNGSSFAPVATSGSASDLGVGTLPHARLPALLSADIPNHTSNTTGNAGTATALASTPTLCPAGSYTLGINAPGNAQNCTALPAFPVGAVVGATDVQVLTNKSIDGSEITSGTLPHARLPVLVAGDIPNNAANTTGTAAAATALAGTPTLCATGTAATGILSNGNATGCAALGGSSSLPGGTGLVVVNSAIGSAVTVSGDGTLNPVTGALAVTKTNGSSFAAVATSGSASDIAVGTLNHARLPALVAADIPNNTANTTGLAGTASALAATPTLCAAGQAPTGILANGNATGCAAAGGGGGSPTITIGTSGPVADPGGASAFLFNNAAGALTFSLPAGVAGFQRCYRNATGVAGAITIAVTASNAIDMNGVNGTTGTGTLVSSGALGDAACVVSDSINHWYTSVSSGTWTNN